METEEVVEKATIFLEQKAGYYTHKLVSVRLEDNVWILRFDTGYLIEKIVEMKIDDTTGRVIEYARPE